MHWKETLLRLVSQVSWPSPLLFGRFPIPIITYWGVVELWWCQLWYNTTLIWHLAVNISQLSSICQITSITSVRIYLACYFAFCQKSRSYSGLHKEVYTVSNCYEHWLLFCNKLIQAQFSLYFFGRFFVTSGLVRYFLFHALPSNHETRNFLVLETVIHNILENVLIIQLELNRKHFKT